MERHDEENYKMIVYDKHAQSVSSLPHQQEGPDLSSSIVTICVLVGSREP